MTFTESIRTVLRQKYATFSGRASRSEFWWFQLFYWLLLLAYLLVIFSLGQFSASMLNGNFTAFGSIISIPAFLVILGLFIPSIALQVRRFHDHNLSGWWYLLILLLSAIPYLGALVALAMLALFILPGTNGPNKFGPDSRNPDITADVFE